MKYLKKIFIRLGFILGIVLFIFILNYLRINVFYQINKKNYHESFNVPGNKNGYVPQGMAYDKEHNIILQNSYNGDGKVSKLYVTDFKTKKLIKELKLKLLDGTNDYLHVGGIATNGSNVWITSDYNVSEFSLDEILTTKNDYIKSYNDTKLPIRGDFCYYHDDSLWIGDFYLNPFYKVPDNTPLLFKYNSQKELNYSEPELIISLPKMVQGMTITDNNNFVFTRSFTYLVNSSLSTYKNVLKEKPTTYNLKGKEIPYYHFTKDNLIKNEKIPPMAEGLFYKDKSLYILFENSSDHYKLALPKMNKVIKKSTSYLKCTQCQGLNKKERV